MGRSRTTFRTGHKGRGGRPPGALNRSTLEVRALARELLEDPAYLAALRRRLVAGEAGQMEPLLFRYAYGGPPETPASLGDATRPVSTGRGKSNTAPALELSKAGREKLLALADDLKAHLNDAPPMATASDPEP